MIIIEPCVFCDGVVPADVHHRILNMLGDKDIYAVHTYWMYVRDKYMTSRRTDIMEIIRGAASIDTLVDDVRSGANYTNPNLYIAIRIRIPACMVDDVTEAILNFNRAEVFFFTVEAKYTSTSRYVVCPPHLMGFRLDTPDPDLTPEAFEWLQIMELKESALNRNAHKLSDKGVDGIFNYGAYEVVAIAELSGLLEFLLQQQNAGKTNDISILAENSLDKIRDYINLLVEDACDEGEGLDGNIQ